MNPLIERRLVLGEPRTLERFRIGEVRNCAGFAAHHAIEVGPDSVIVLHEGMALAAMTVKGELKVRATAFLLSDGNSPERWLRCSKILTRLPKQPSRDEA